MFSQMRLFSSESCGRYWDTLYQLSSSVTHLSISCQASKSFQIWNRFGTPGSLSFAKHLSFPSMSNPPSLPDFIGVRCQQGFHIRRVFLHREPRRVTTLAAPWKRFAMEVEVENGWTSMQRINMWGMWIYYIVLSLHREETMRCYGCRNDWSSEDKNYTANSHGKISIVVFVIMYGYIFLIIDLEVYLQLKSKTNREKDTTRFLTPG